MIIFVKASTNELAQAQGLTEGAVEISRFFFIVKSITAPFTTRYWFFLRCIFAI